MSKTNQLQDDSPKPRSRSSKNNGGSYNKMAYFFGEGAQSIFKHGFMSFASITVIVACLVIMGSFSLLALNINVIMERLEAENEMLAFVDETWSLEQAVALESAILRVTNVREIEFVTRDDALDSFASRYDSDLISELDETIFRHRYIIYVEDLELMGQTQNDLLSVEGIAKVSAHIDISESFLAVRNVVSAVSVVLVVMLFIVSMFIMSNTIKLTTFDRREEIAIMKMVGATDSFIRWPFFFEGMILGITGAVISFFLQWGVYEIVAGRLMGEVTGVFTLVQVVAFESISLPLVLIFLAVGFAVGIAGSLIAIKNYLWV